MIKAQNKVRRIITEPFNKLIDSGTIISSIDNVIKCGPDDTLGSVLPLVQSSHSGIFVVDSDGEFVGIVSPYQALYTRRYAHTTKVSSIAKMPPFITIKTQLNEVASFMLESRVYNLPLFDDKKQVKGVIDSKNIFQNLIKNQNLLMFISSTIKPHKLVTANRNSSVGDIFQVMKEKNVSRVVLVDDKGNLSGIVSRKDLHNAFMKPTEKQRFGKNGMQKTDRAFDEEKQYRKGDPAKKYATDRVSTLPNDTKHEDIIKHLITSEQNSVVLMDKYLKPVSIISMRDVLTALASLHQEEKINIIMTKPSNSVSQSEINKAEKFLTRFGQKMKKRMAISKLEIIFEEPKTPTGDTILFNTSLTISPIAGEKIISKTKSRSFLDGVRSAAAQIEKQQRRSGISKANSK